MKKLSRRGFLGVMAAGTGAAVAACNPAIDKFTQPGIPDSLQPPGGATRHPIAHLLNRTTFGGRPGQIQEVERMGRASWLDQQLDYDSIGDQNLGIKLSRFDSLSLSPVDILSFHHDEEYITDELAASTLLRAVYSKQQLFEVMVGFWSDHFSIYHFKTKTALLKTVDDREVIRKHALGNFGEMLRKSAHSPAMLFYLDNVENEKSHPNENYAREIMELHTLGVDGGYTERDIQEVARCLTGWGMNNQGKFEFRGDWHDYGEKTVLGHTIPAGNGKEDGDRVLDILIDHPSTVRYVCTKLMRRFISDDPPADVVDACVETWRGSKGNLKQIMRTLLTHPSFETAAPKLKRPFELMVSLLRALNAQYDGSPQLVYLLDRMGHRPFGWTTPDGYPDTAEKWSGNLLGRWNMAVDGLHNNLPGVSVNLMDIAERGDVEHDADKLLAFYGRLLLSRDLNEAERLALWEFALGERGKKPDLSNDSGIQQMTDTLALLVASPAFQWR